jgi:transcriptional regulator of arginine metabolism
VNRRERQGEILRLVREQELGTQAELVEALRAAGHDVVQTTVSRDVAELGLVKVRSAAGRLVYAPPGPTPSERRAALRAALRRWALSFETSGNLVVVATPPGYASPLAQALDEASHPHVAGTIAGDNTIFVAVRDGVAAVVLRDELHDHLLEGAA